MLNDQQMAILARNLCDLLHRVRYGDVTIVVVDGRVRLIKKTESLDVSTNEWPN